MREKKEDIKSYIERKDPLIITINFLPGEYQPDMLFLSNTKRYMQLSSRLEKAEGKALIPVIATSNLTAAGEGFDYDLDYSSLIDEGFEIPDNSLPMCLRMLHKAGVKKAALAGFDGYVTEKGKNYSEPAMEYEFAADYAIRLNSYTAGVINGLKKDMDIEFVTPSRYEV